MLDGACGSFRSPSLRTPPAQVRLGASAAAGLQAASFETVVPYGLVPGDLLTPTAGAAIAEVEAGFKGAARMAAMRLLRGASAGDPSSTGGDDGSDSPEGRANDVQVRVV